MSLVITVSLRFYEELNDFLPRGRRKRDFEISFPEPRSVKDLIESLGVPHTEIDLILANGDSVGFDHAVADGDRIAVYPVFEAFDITTVSRLGRPALREPKFLADVHLGRLTRLLRLLGLDCAYRNGASDAELAAWSVGERRILLTRDRGLLKRREISHGICIRSTETEEQAREVIRRIQLEGRLRPFTRCLRCGGSLAAVSKESVLEKIPERTRRTANAFHQCDSCRQVFWPGSHYGALKNKVDRFLEYAQKKRARKSGPPDGVLTE